MFEPYRDYKVKEKARRREEKELKRRGVWDPRFNARQASSLPSQAS